MFKPLHVWSSKEATGNGKKNGAEPEMGYCPLSIRQARSLGAQGAGAGLAVRGTQAGLAGR